MIKSKVYLNAFDELGNVELNKKEAQMLCEKSSKALRYTLSISEGNTLLDAYKGLQSIRARSKENGLKEKKEIAMFAGLILSLCLSKMNTTAGSILTGEIV